MTQLDYREGCTHQPPSEAAQRAFAMGYNCKEIGPSALDALRREHTDDY